MPCVSAPTRIYWGCFYFFPWLRMWRRDCKREHPRPLEMVAGLWGCSVAGG
uniref:Uncharacterized protein n=1 Tax=Sphenodon punctatus TaxID=8508 RepID=A0A8D0H102_SPHPU